MVTIRAATLLALPLRAFETQVFKLAREVLATAAKLMERNVEKRKRKYTREGD